MLDCHQGRVRSPIILLLRNLKASKPPVPVAIPCWAQAHHLRIQDPNGAHRGKQGKPQKIKIWKRLRVASPKPFHASRQSEDFRSQPSCIKSNASSSHGQTLCSFLYLSELLSIMRPDTSALWQSSSYVWTSLTSSFQIS